MSDNTVDKKGILLETGTNEFEIVEFNIGKVSYGINVAKVREVINRDSVTVTKMPQVHPFVDGLFTLRGRVMPLVNLPRDVYKRQRLYNERLAKRPQIIAANKMDIPEAKENYEKLKAFANEQGIEIFPVSAATNEGLKPLIERVSQMLDEYVEEPEAIEEVKVYQAKPDDEITISRDEAGDFVVKGK